MGNLNSSSSFENPRGIIQGFPNARAVMAIQEGTLGNHASNDHQNISPEDIRAAMIEERINRMAAGALNKSE